MSSPFYYAHVGTDGALATNCKALAGKSVIIREKKSQRSLDQNSWLWGVAIPLIADHCGYDEHERDMLHYELLSVRFGTVTGKTTGAQMPAKTSSQLNTKEFSEYMEWLVRWAATTLDVVIPLPDEPLEP